MQWQQTQTDRDWDAQHRIMEDMRHERLVCQSMLVSPIETTGSAEQVPRMTMDRYRKSKLEAEVRRSRSILSEFQDNDDNIPDL